MLGVFSLASTLSVAVLLTACGSYYLPEENSFKILFSAMIKLNAVFWGIRQGSAQLLPVTVEQKQFNPVSGDFLQGTVKIPVKKEHNKYTRTNFKVKVGSVNYIQAHNGSGKSTVCSLVIPGKSPYRGAQHFFKSEQAWVINSASTKALNLSCDEQLIDEIRERFNVSESHETEFINAFGGLMKEIGLGYLLPINTSDGSKFSDGEKS